MNINYPFLIALRAAISSSLHLPGVDDPIDVRWRPSSPLHMFQQLSVDRRLNLITLDNPPVGKLCLLNTLIGDPFGSASPTIGIPPNISCCDVWLSIQALLPANNLLLWPFVTSEMDGWSCCWEKNEKHIVTLIQCNTSKRGICRNTSEMKSIAVIFWMAVISAHPIQTHMTHSATP
jgi:hypothetical protein